MTRPITLTTVQQVREWSTHVAAKGSRIGCVPTMGGLHAGHAKLIRMSADRHAQTIVTIFVNPLQFGPNEDFAKYPRTLQADLDLCEANGASAVFVADKADLYPVGFETHVVPGLLADVMCGASRPGHFRGVATVVLKLLNIVQPTEAFFGRKDFQQLTIIQRMVTDLNLAVTIVPCETIREPDGLALSTRNQYLSATDRRQATCLYRAIQAIRLGFRNGERDLERLKVIGYEIIQAEPSARVDYLVIVRPDSLIETPEVTSDHVVAMAVHIGATRLIDNGVISAPEAM